MFQPSLALFSALTLLVAPHLGRPTPMHLVDIDVAVVGRVTDAGTAQPILGARLRMDGASAVVSSNAFGRYLLALDDGLLGREVTISVTAVGYAPASVTLVLADGANVADFVLDAAASERDELEAKVGPQPGLPERVTLGIAGRAASASDLARPVAPPARGGFDREGYAHIAENDFMAVGPNPLSTFSIDVDRASYSNVRRFIRDGVRPPVDAVRIEELVNYFPYSDRAPDGDVPFSVTTEVSPAPWQPVHQLVRIGLKGRSIDMSDAPASNLVFLLDVSGSMNSPDKLPLLKTAFGLLVEQLRPQDRVAIVVYAGAAGLVLPSTSGAHKDAILDALGGLSAGGSTAGGAGIQLAYAVAAENHIEGGNNRVILATDGDFNVGASSDAEMIRLVEDKRRQGTFLTVLGFGTGNLQDAKMEQIADHGNGNFAYIDSALEAKKVLVSEMGGTLVTIAQDVKIQVELNPARVAAYRLIGYENRLLAAEDFEDDTKDAGELGAGHSVTALYEIIPVGVESPVDVRGVDSLRYQGVRPQADASDGDELMFVKLRYQQPGGSTSRLVTHPVRATEALPSDDFRFAAAVAAWGMLLRDSEHCAGYSLDRVAELARGALGEDREGYRAEFVRLVERTRSLELLAAAEVGSR